MTLAEEIRADAIARGVHSPWWDYIDVVPVQLLVDEQLRSAWERWVARLRRSALRRVPGSYGSAAR